MISHKFPVSNQRGIGSLLKSCNISVTSSGRAEVALYAKSRQLTVAMPFKHRPFLEKALVPLYIDLRKEIIAVIYVNTE